MYILDLPSEIIQKILDHSDPRHLYELAFVCKSWHVPALHRWYNTLFLNNLGYKTAMGLFKLDAEQRDRYFQYAPLVKRLEIGVPDPDIEDLDTLWEPNTEDFSLFLEYFPNVLVLNINDTNHANRCLERIASSPPINALQNIQHITSSMSICQTESWRIHFAACYSHRTTITKLSTCYIKNMFDGRDNFDLLRDFTQLSDLRITNYLGENVSMIDIFAISPKLKVFDYRISGTMSEDSIKIFLENKPTKHSMNTALDTLKLWVSSISANYLRYIMDYISLQLQSLDLKLYDIDFYSWLAEVGVDIVLRFAERLSKMNRFHITWTLPNEDSEVISDMSRSNIKDFFKMVKAFKADKNTFFRSTFNNFSDKHWFCYVHGLIEQKEEYFQNRIEYNSKTGYNFQYTLESSNFNCFKTKFYDDHDVQEDIDLPTDIDGLEKLNFINVNLFNDYFNPDGLFEILQLVLINCPNLEFYQHTSLCDESVKLNHMIIGANLTHFGTDQQVDYYHQRSTETKENLRSVKFHNILPSQKLLDLLLTHLPNIEAISVLGNDPDHVRFKKSVIDLTGFKDLHNIYFDVETIPDKIYFVHLQYTDDDDTSNYYYQSSRSLRLIGSSFVRVCLDCDSSTRVVTIKCKKDIKVTIGSPDVGVLAEIVNGCHLSHISDDSHKNYKVLTDGFKQSK